jgi:hypothetical protein
MLCRPVLHLRGEEVPTVEDQADRCSSDQTCLDDVMVLGRQEVGCVRQIRNRGELDPPSGVSPTADR